MGDLKVIGAGFPRTGTSTLKSALEILGYDRCYHMKELLVHPGKLNYWKEIEKFGKTNFETLFQGYQSCVDVPGYPYYKILMERYPDAKIVLTHRPFDEWYESASETIRNAGPQTVLQKILLLTQMPFKPRLRKSIAAIKFFENIFWSKQFHGSFENKSFAKEIYFKHIKDVKNHVSSDRLLVYEVTQGWAPLCSFLNKEIPSIEFPHLNKKENFDKMLLELINGNMV